MFTRTMLIASAITTTGLMTSTARAGGEKIGVSVADAPNLSGSFVIHNPTNTAINYQVKWGKGEWKSFTVKPGFKYTHTHSLDANNKAPAPYVRFDNYGGDGKVTNTEVHMKFGLVGYAGYGPVGYVDKAWHYEFKYRPDRRNLDLIER
jgi:hypothetical protein